MEFISTGAPWIRDDASYLFTPTSASLSIVSAAAECKNLALASLLAGDDQKLLLIYGFIMFPIRKPSGMRETRLIYSLSAKHIGNICLMLNEKWEDKQTLSGAK